MRNMNTRDKIIAIMCDSGDMPPAKAVRLADKLMANLGEYFFPVEDYHGKAQETP